MNQSVQGNADGTNVTLNLGENAHVLLTGDVTARAGSTFSYNLSEGSSLELHVVRTYSYWEKQQRAA